MTSPDAAADLTPAALKALSNDGTTAILAAAVDSLPGSKGSDGARVSGHSWLVTDHVLPIRVPTSPASLTFSLPTTSFTLPLANTVFQTGATSTFHHLPATTKPKFIEAAVEVPDEQVEEFANAQEDINEAWQELGDLMKMVGVKSGLFPHTPVPVDSVEIQLNADVLETRTGSGKIFSSLPLKALTPARKISEGLGNILRALDSPVGVEPGASRELEVAVDEYIASLPVDTPVPERVDVFARLTAQEPGTPLPNELLLYPGARIHRVLSGGGGWGNRAGLLSLDPQGERDVANFSNEFEKRFEGSDEAHGGVVKVGEWVQFFVAEAAGPVGKGIRFGAVGKVEDVQPTENGEEKTLKGLFGGASELGVDVGVAGRARRMNVPGGDLVVDV